MALKFIKITNYDQLTQSEIDAIEAQASADSGGVHRFTVSPIAGNEGHAYIEMEESNAPVGATIHTQAEMKIIVGTSEFKEEPIYDYVQLRQQAYPSLGDQLDKIFHDGIDSWKADIQVIKDLYPKPE